MGDPIAHSLSPLLHNTAFALLGLDWVSVGFPVPTGGASEALAAIVPLGIAGLSVTMPHKRAAAELADELTPIAVRLQAVNCLVNRDGRLLGTNTDGQGFLDALARGAGFDPAGKRCVVIGAGGGARAVVVALGEAAASEVVVVARRPEPAVAAAELVPRGRVGSARDAPDADLVVNATPVGMPGNESATETAIVPGEALGPGQVVVDLVYQPAETGWMAAATRKGAVVLGGLGMLVHQAAAQLELWTGLTPPVDAMWAAAEAARTERRNGKA
ncbi:MAG: shikimate dehydrogenase [Acidimicrobiales bacterium]